MAWLQWAALALQVVATMKSAADEADAMKAEGQQYRAKANENVAVSQRLAQQELWKGEVLASRAQAVAAASGGGATDPTVVHLISQIEGDAEYQALSRLYEGTTAANDLRYKKKLLDAQAKQTKSAALWKAAGTLASGYAGIRAGAPPKTPGAGTPAAHIVHVPEPGSSGSSGYTGYSRAGGLS